MGLLHILPRLGKSGGHIPHSSPFSYSRRLSPFSTLPPPTHTHPSSLFFPFIFTSKPRSFVAGAGEGGTHGTHAGELLEERTERAASSGAERRGRGGGRPCALEYRTRQRPLAAHRSPPRNQVITCACACASRLFVSAWGEMLFFSAGDISRSSPPRCRCRRPEFLKLAGLKITIGRRQNALENVLQRSRWELLELSDGHICLQGTKFGPLVAFFLLSPDHFKVHF